MTIELTQLKFTKKLIEKSLSIIHIAQKDASITAELTSEELGKIHACLHSWNMITEFLINSFDYDLLEYNFGEYLDMGQLWQVSTKQLSDVAKFMKRYHDHIEDVPSPIYSVILSFMTISNAFMAIPSVQLLLESLATAERNFKPITDDKDYYGEDDV